MKEDNSYQHHVIQPLAQKGTHNEDIYGISTRYPINVLSISSKQISTSLIVSLYYNGCIHYTGRAVQLNSLYKEAGAKYLIYICTSNNTFAPVFQYWKKSDF